MALRGQLLYVGYFAVPLVLLMKESAVKLSGLVIVGSLVMLLLAAACAEGLEPTPTRPPTRSAADISSGGTDLVVPPVDTPDTTSTGCELSITTPSDDLKYDIDFMSVKSGCDVVVKYVNNATAFKHNWVLVKTGTKDDVARCGGDVPPDYVCPGDDNVLQATIPLVEPGETRELRFPAPPVGKYEFVCTFPGHNATKFGVFEVTSGEEASATRAPAQQTETTAPAASDEAEAVPSGGTAGETALTITTPGDDLRYDTASLSAKAGTEVVLTYVNNSTAFKHNWVLVKAGTKDAVAADGGLAPENGHIPEGDDRVLAATIPLVDPGETRELRFPAPPVGEYEFVCTFPGHNATKFGVFEVTE